MASTCLWEWKGCSKVTSMIFEVQSSGNRLLSLLTGGILSSGMTLCVPLIHLHHSLVLMELFPSWFTELFYLNFEQCNIFIPHKQLETKFNFCLDVTYNRLLYWLSVNEHLSHSELIFTLTITVLWLEWVLNIKEIRGKTEFTLKTVKQNTEHTNSMKL